VVIEANENIEIAKTYLVAKSRDSTMNPKNDSLHHHFAATKFVVDGVRVVKFTTGIKSYVVKTINDYIKKKGHELALEPFYNANGFDLRQNCKTEFSKARKQRIQEINKRNKEADRKHNKVLDIDIRKHNKANPDNKRNYHDEKHTSKKVCLCDISVKFALLTFKYVENPHMSFDEVFHIVVETNRNTQESPLTDDE